MYSLRFQMSGSNFCNDMNFILADWFWVLFYLFVGFFWFFNHNFWWCLSQNLSRTGLQETLGQVLYADAAVSLDPS